MLAAWAKGIGTCYCGAAPMQRVVDDLKEYLKLPDNIRPFAIVTMGYPAETPKQPEGRFKEEKSTGENIKVFEPPRQPRLLYYCLIS